MRKFLLALPIAIIAVPAAAQEQGTASLYASPHYKGASIAVSRGTTHIPPFKVNSLRIAPGTVWELCSGNTFSGCKRFSQSTPGMVFIVRSVRPVPAPLPASAALAASGGSQLTGSGPSLRGLASEFFALPAQGGARVEVDKAAGQSAAATEFCRARGWRMSAHERVQSVEGRDFLADVLCVNE